MITLQAASETHLLIQQQASSSDDDDPMSPSSVMAIDRHVKQKSNLDELGLQLICGGTPLDSETTADKQRSLAEADSFEKKPEKFSSIQIRTAEDVRSDKIKTRRKSHANLDLKAMNSANELV